MTKLVFIPLSILAAIMFASFGGSAKAVVNPIQCSDTSCSRDYSYYQQPQADSFSGTSSLGTGGFDAYTRCFYDEHGKGAGILHEGRRITIKTKWCSRNSQITGSWTTVGINTGLQCHPEWQEGPVRSGGGVGTSAIYIYTKVHFACDIGIIWPGVVTLHPSVWINIRYGVNGGSSVDYSGADRF